MATRSEQKYTEIGGRIRAARLSRGLSQERFAPVVGVTRRHLIRLENGEHLPGLELRQRLAEATGATPEHFSLDEDDEDSLPSELIRRAVEALADLVQARIGLPGVPSSNTDGL